MNELWQKYRNILQVWACRPKVSCVSALCQTANWNAFSFSQRCIILVDAFCHQLHFSESCKQSQNDVQGVSSLAIWITVCTKWLCPFDFNTLSVFYDRTTFARKPVQTFLVWNRICFSNPDWVKTCLPERMLDTECLLWHFWRQSLRSHSKCANKRCGLNIWMKWSDILKCFQKKKYQASEKGYARLDT